MTNEKNTNHYSLITILALYFIINSVLLTFVHSGISRTIIISIDIAIGLAIILLFTKSIKNPKGK